MPFFESLAGRATQRIGSCGSTESLSEEACRLHAPAPSGTRGAPWPTIPRERMPGGSRTTERHRSSFEVFSHTTEVELQALTTPGAVNVPEQVLLFRVVMDARGERSRRGRAILSTHSSQWLIGMPILSS